MKTILITGAAGFIGNAACAHYKDKYHVIGVDDMSRQSAKRPEAVAFFCEDVAEAVAGLRGVDIVLHLAAQVSVMKSIEDPVDDCLRNAIVTFHLARWAASLSPRPIFIYANTNKVFGELVGVKSPILDSQPLAPSTPYGISKATGGMYVRELLPDTGYDFRQSCIFSEHQQGSWDQGWVGYLSRQIRNGEPVVCYGDGEQVRDLLHVDKLLTAYDAAIEGRLPAGSYCVGGGPNNAYTFADVVEMMGGTIARFEPKRPKDQNYFVALNDGLWHYARWVAHPFPDAEEIISKYMGVNRKAVTK